MKNTHTHRLFCFGFTQDYSTIFKYLDGDTFLVGVVSVLQYSTINN